MDEKNINVNIQNGYNLSIPIAIVLAGFAIAVGIYLSNRGNAPLAGNNANIPTQESITLKPVSKTDHLLGNPDALVTIVEFSDTECPFCKMFQTTMQTIMNTYGKDGKVAWVYRYFPLDSLHSKSRKEAEAIECAGELGGNTAFWKMLDTVYTETPSNNGLDAALIPGFAKDAGVDTTKFNECWNSGKYASLIQAELQDGINAGVEGTPYSVLVLRKNLSSDAENSLQTYILNNNLARNVSISSSKKEVTMNGALPLQMIQSILDIVLK